MEVYLDLDGNPRFFDPADGSLYRSPLIDWLLVRMPQGTWFEGVKDENELGFRLLAHSRRPWETYTYLWREISLADAVDCFQMWGEPIPPTLTQDIQDQPQPGSGSATKTENVGKETKPPTTRKPMKEPSAKAIAAYRAVRWGKQKETSVAPMFGVNQSTISRWIDKVVEWLEAGNVLPDELAAPPSRPKTKTMDPRKLEQGPRRRGRA